MGQWTGAEVRALLDVSSYDQTSLAARLGAGRRSVVRWLKEGADSNISPTYQLALDTLLAKCSTEVRLAFFLETKGRDEAMGILNRRALIMGGSSAAALGLTATFTPSPAQASEPLADPDRLEAVAVDNADPDRIADILDILHLSMRRDDQKGAGAALHLTESARVMARDLHNVAQRQETLTLWAECIAFAGTLAFDLGQHDRALAMYKRARERAREADDADLAGYILCHMAQLEVWLKRIGAGEDHANAATAQLLYTADRPLRAYANLRAAQALARSGPSRRDQTLRALDAAWRDIPTEPLTPEQSRGYFCGPGLFHSYSAECFAAIGLPDRAVKAAALAASHFGADMVRDRALASLNMHKGLVKAGRIDQAAAAIGDAARLTSTNRSRRLVGAISEARNTLLPWSDAEAVRDLDDVLTEHAIVAI